LGEAKKLEDLCGLMFHEGSHSWFQQIIATNESMKPWMDEGFTSYAESIAMNRLFPPQQSMPNPFVGTLENYRKFVKSGKEEPAVWLGDHHDDGRAYTFSTYVKGELFLVQLGYIVGEPMLSSIMKEYYQQWKLKHPSDRDFLHIAQKMSGMDLKWFHHYWIKEVSFGEKSTTITLVNKGSVPMPIDFSVLTKDKKVVNYQIPLNLTRVWKNKDINGNFTSLDYWSWTQKEYTFTIPYTKDQLLALGIDFSQRLADVNMEDNFYEVKLDKVSK
jgi:aminopeptidase N